MTCTEYGMEPTFSNDGSIQLNKEPMNVYNLLSGINYVTNPKITKVAFKPPYDEVINTTETPMHHPMIRIPI